MQSDTSRPIYLLTPLFLTYFLAEPEHGLELVCLGFLTTLHVLPVSICCQVLSNEHLLTVLLGIYFMARPEHGL